MPECAHRLMRCRPSLVRGRAAQVNPGGFTTPARRPSVPHRTAGCGKSSLRPLMAGSSPSLPDGSNPSAAIVQSASDVQCSRLLKTTGGLNTRVTSYLLENRARPSLPGRASLDDVQRLPHGAVVLWGLFHPQVVEVLEVPERRVFGASDTVLATRGRQVDGLHRDRLSRA